MFARFCSLRLSFTWAKASSSTCSPTQAYRLQPPNFMNKQTRQPAGAVLWLRDICQVHLPLLCRGRYVIATLQGTAAPQRASTQSHASKEQFSEKHPARFHIHSFYMYVGLEMATKWLMPISIMDCPRGHFLVRSPTYPLLFPHAHIDSRKQ